MSSPDVRRPALEAEIAREIIGLVPHWYEAECGPVRYAIPVRGHVAHFYNHARLAPGLSTLLARICARTETLPLEHFVELPGLVPLLLESFTIEWLRINAPGMNWPKLLKYLDSLAMRTHENEQVLLNLILRQKQGCGDISRPEVQKFFDRLASSPFSYLAIDSELRLIDYGEVEWSHIKGAASYKFHPEFLQPIQSVMGPDDLSAHMTGSGDIVIANKAGLLAARRKGHWRVYDMRTFKNSLFYCLGNYDVAANLFEVVFDLSFKRRGALLVYDPEHKMRGRILNSESLLHPDWRGRTHAEDESGQSLIAPSILDIAPGKPAGSLKRKQRLIEMACCDGALVFDDERLLAVGAIIQSHPDVGNVRGARAAAAKSVYLWGGRPIQVSSDGDVSIRFKSSGEGASCDAIMRFL